MSALALLVIVSSHSVSGETLRPGPHFIKQSWSQETDYERTYHVRLPERSPSTKAPVLIVLHGNGGSGRSMVQRIAMRYRRIASKYVLIFPDGYRASWNIAAEKSKADDRGFIESIIQTLSRFDNVRADHVTILGVSNGAALANQLAIESPLESIRNVITVVSHLNALQHDGNEFRFKGVNNDYAKIATPLTGKRILNVSGANDPLIPYRGGPSRGIPGKVGKLEFLAAEDSIFQWAKWMGHDGARLRGPTKREGQFARFEYLNGDVVHYRVDGEGHGAMRAISEDLLLDFLGERPRGR